MLRPRLVVLLFNFSLLQCPPHCYSATLNVAKVTLAESHCKTHDSPLKIFQLFFMLPPCSAPQTRSFPTWKSESCSAGHYAGRVFEVHRGTSWDPWLIFPQVASTFFMPFSISDIWLWSHAFKLVSVASCGTQQQRWRLSLLKWQEIKHPQQWSHHLLSSRPHHAKEA